ncbi:MAG: hypothetical protein PHV34_01635 [Verrucomicrobiae bacterium]|nr:hypothetical protein [Verrucomicrobiae bacterium]
MIAFNLMDRPDLSETVISKITFLKKCHTNRYGGAGVPPSIVCTVKKGGRGSRTAYCLNIFPRILRRIQLPTV